jgi:hypothetical protein
MTEKECSFVTSEQKHSVPSKSSAIMSLPPTTEKTGSPFSFLPDAGLSVQHNTWSITCFNAQEAAGGRGQLKCDGTQAETRVHLSAKRTNPFKSAGASVQSTTGSRGMRISSSNAGYTVFRGSVKGSGYPLISPVSPSLPLPCVIMCHHISTGVCNLTVMAQALKQAWYISNKQHQELAHTLSEGGLVVFFFNKNKM